MDEEEFFREFCTVMRRRGEVKLKNLSNIFEIPEKEARKHINTLIKKNKIKRTGAGPSTAYLFA